MQELKAMASSFDETTQFYIDQDLGVEGDGLEVCKWLSDHGFVNIYLATGHPASNFKNIPFLKGVVGKTPPF